MNKAFIIMQIGNKDMDIVYEKAIYPALKSSGLNPIRVDKHNEGRLLKSEIVEFIETSDIIIADLTNERPNCYLEVGYAMGLDKFRNLILTAREDHHHESTNYNKNGPKIHFDLSGYDILFWNAENLNYFRDELKKRVKRRLAILAPNKSSTFFQWDDNWISKHSKLAFSNFKKYDKKGFMEIRISLTDNVLDFSQNEILRIADQAQINTFGWPIGIVMKNREEYIPKPKTDGITAEIATKSSYDYWSIRKDGSFYLFKSLFEDDRRPGHLIIQTHYCPVKSRINSIG